MKRVFDRLGLKNDPLAKRALDLLRS